MRPGLRIGYACRSLGAAHMACPRAGGADHWVSPQQQKLAYARPARPNRAWFVPASCCLPTSQGAIFCTLVLIGYPPQAARCYPWAAFCPHIGSPRDFPNICAGRIRIRVTRRRMSQRLLNARETVGAVTSTWSPFRSVPEHEFVFPSGSSTF